MSVHDDLGTRMKEFYEQIPKTKLIRRTPVIIRVDGKAFHTFTRGFQRPFDEILVKTMQETTKYLCENIQGCVLGYTQSDEISLVLVDYQKFKTSAWFDYEVQKMCSIAASMATMAFNKIFLDNIDLAYHEEFDERGLNSMDYFENEAEYNETLEELEKKYEVYCRKANEAMFDARVFNVPKEEVTNYIYWRQLDASRNSIQMVGQANFSHKELYCKTCNDIQDMLMTQKGINWNDLLVYQKRGSCVIKTKETENVVKDNIGTDGSRIGTTITVRSKWIIDKDIPIFKAKGREYVEKLIMVGE